MTVIAAIAMSSIKIWWIRYIESNGIGIARVNRCYLLLVETQVTMAIDAKSTDVRGHRRLDASVRCSADGSAVGGRDAG